MVTALARTRPWVLFFSIIMFVSMGFCVLTIALQLLNVSELGGVGALFLLAYLCLAIVYAGCGLYLLRYAEHLREFVRTRSPRVLEAAVVAQWNYWRLWGKLMICSIVVTVAMAVVIAATFGLLVVGASS